MKEIQRRVAATAKTKDRFDGKPFDWKKAATCVHLMRYHASKMGHNIRTVPRFRSALSAKRVLKELGFDTLPELMDSYFDRIPPAEMRTGDVAAFPGEDGFESLMIYGQLRAFIGWHQDAPECQMVRVSNDAYGTCLGAWRL
ncbi:MAG: hypothetical protein AAGB23_07615 [Pseudomonadota bacterium]